MCACTPRSGAVASVWLGLARLHDTLATAPGLLAHALVTEIVKSHPGYEVVSVGAFLRGPRLSALPHACSWVCSDCTVCECAGFEVAGGGFEWFGSAPAHEALTAYGALQFQDMAKVHRLTA